MGNSNRHYPFHQRRELAAERLRRRVSQEHEPGYDPYNSVDKWGAPDVLVIDHAGAPSSDWTLGVGGHAVSPRRYNHNDSGG